MGTLVSTTNTALTTPAVKVLKSRYFSVELKCVNMRPSTTYQFFVDGIDMSAFVKPYGKNLGDPIISQGDGTLIVQYHMSIPFSQNYLTNKVDEAGYIQQTKQLEFRDPAGRSSSTYLPVGLKITQ